jgi:peptide deformylase
VIVSVRELRYLGDAVLRQKAVPVGALTDDVRRLIEDMFDTMYAEEGVGLAAPQVGVSQRVIVVDPREPDVAPFALVDPEVVEASDEYERGEEGCLSIPGLKEIVERPYAVRVAGLNQHGEAVVMEAEGLLARILQHEVDHLDGILFLDRVSPLKRKLLLSRWQKSRS